MNGYLLFRSLVEVFSIVIAGSVFVTTWNTRTYHVRAGSFFLLIGIASLFAGSLDLVHTLAYKGINIFPAYDTNLPTQLWIAARYLQSLTLLAAALLLLLETHRHIHLGERAAYWLLAGYAAVTALFLLAAFSRHFPACYITGVGLTPFKRISEYIICMVLASAGLVLWRVRDYFDRETMACLLAAVVISIFSELAFTLYTDVYGVFNIIGHVLKIVVFALLYKSIVQANLQFLGDSERRFRQLFENLPVGFALHEIIRDTQGKPCDYRFLEVNPAYEELTGLKGPDIIGKTVLQVLPDLEPDWIERYGRVALGGGPVRFENFAKALSKHFEVSAYSPMPGQFATIVVDITQRKRMEEELRESENRLRAIFDQAAVGVALLNTRTGQYVRVNQRYCDFLGYTIEEMLQKTLIDVTFHEDTQQNIEANAQLIDGSRKEFSYEKRYIRKDGSIVWGSLTMSPLWKPGEKPATYLHIAVVEDITDRKKAEQMLVSSHAALLEAQSMGHIGDSSMDVEPRTFVWSDEAYCIHGLQPVAKLSHEIYRTMIQPEDRSHVFAAIQSAMTRKQQEFTIDYRIVRPDGTERFVALTGKTVVDGDGVVTGLRGTMQDITDRKKAEQEKVFLQEQLMGARKLEAVGQLAGGVAHNFNNLLTGIMGSIEIARMDIPPTSPATASLENAQAAAVKAAGLARQLLAFSRNAMIVSVVQNANVLVESALELVSSSLPGSLEVVRNLSPDAWDVLMDAPQFTRVLMELVKNAREAMQDGGTVTIRTRNATIQDDYVASHPYARTGDFVVISVADTGPGIDPAMMEHLFEPFATTRQLGRGMGLAAVFGSVKQAGAGWMSPRTTAQARRSASTCHDTLNSADAPATVMTNGRIP